jgi:hypothetical protein
MWPTNRQLYLAALIYVRLQSTPAQHTARSRTSFGQQEKFCIKILNNKFVFSKHILSKFKHNTQNDSETSFLSIRIQNTTRLSPPHQSHTCYYKRDCRPTLFIRLHTGPAYCRVLHAWSKEKKAS